MDNERIVWPASRTPEDPFAKMADDFAEFVNRGKFSADQVSEAYYRLMGVSDRTDADAAITTILAEMQRLEREHLPASHFIKFARSLEKIEDSILAYTQYVESLPVTESEKQMLGSLVTEGRLGTLEVAVGDQVLAKIPILRRKGNQELMTRELLNALKWTMDRAQNGQTIKFAFIP